MSFVITKICNGVIDNSDGNHRKQVNNVIETLFYGLSEDGLTVNLDLFWSDYADSDHKNSPFDGNELIWRSKDFRDGNSNF